MAYNPLNIFKALAAALDGASALREEIAGLRIDLRENTAVSRENIAVMRDGSTRAMHELTKELRETRKRLPR